MRAGFQYIRVRRGLRRCWGSTWASTSSQRCSSASGPVPGWVFLFTAIAVTDMSLAGYLYRAVRNVESDRVLVSAER